MNHIALLAVGGTIASCSNEVGELVPRLSAAELLERAPRSNNIAVEPFDFECLPSWNIGPPEMLRLSRAVDEAAERGNGVVITHGTDTLEESAAFLSSTCQTSRTIAMTGAMRPADHPGADGPANLRDAVLVAASAEASQLGCLVVFAGQIHIGTQVRKSNSAALAPFCSPNTGPIGVVSGDLPSRSAVWIGARPRRRNPLRVAHADAYVPILQAVSGLSVKTLEAVLASEPDGLVVEGTGLGHVPGAWMSALRGASQRIPVLLTTRTGAGPVAAVSGGPGGGYDLREAGVIPAGWRTGRCARIELICAVGAGLRGETLRKWIIDSQGGST